MKNTFNNKEERRSLNLPVFQKIPGAVAIDLDGTLLDSQAGLSSRSLSALAGCLELGIPVIIATARPARIFKRIFPPELADRISLVIMNGAIAIGKPPLSGYFQETLPEKVVRDIVNLSLKFDNRILVTLELDGYELGANWTADADTLWQRNSATLEMLIPLEKAISMDPCKIALGGIGPDIFKLTERLLAGFKGSISVIPSLINNPMLNITAHNASKPAALRKLLNPKGISLAEVAAFGDDIPDITMLQECGISIAVANAFPEAKSVCKYLTASNDEDGVAIVLEEIVRSENTRRCTSKHMEQ
jgi:Cof subfamily protein (haloacid dehalogenase superfamily)